MSSRPVRTDTKKWRIEQARKLIDSQRVNVEFSQKATDEMNELLGTAFDSFCKRRNPVYPGDTRHIYACFSGMWKDVSWKNLIIKPSPMALAKRALRESVAPDLRDAFYAIEPHECAVCSSLDDLTVDHLDEPFNSIATSWIALRGTPDLKEPPHGQGLMFADADLEADWIAFHASRATYQIACRSCNSQKGARGTAWHDQYRQGKGTE
jgi:hypothetical protein